MNEKDNIIKALDFIDPDCPYEEWLQVGMALHYEGFSIDAWDTWSARGSKYQDGCCTQRWSGFGRSAGAPVTGATIIKMAMERGYFAHDPSDFCMEFDDAITDDGDGFTFRSDYNPAEDFRRYIKALFQDDDIVAYITEARQTEEGGKWIPANKGCFDRTAGQLLAELDKHPDDLGAVLGDWNKEAGAWIRFNPVDGEGVNNANVTAFRYALVESDDLPIAKQNELYREHNLPIAALVHSGGKSLHAIVHIDAKNYEEYQKRVSTLYEYLADSGITIDKANRNPSRLSRMPGVDRKGVWQKLVATNIGAANWLEWQDWLDGELDETPDFRAFGEEQMSSEIPLSPVIIDGILKKGNVMLLTGASKAGKSTTLMELASTLSLGEKWIGRQCTKSKVLYCNMELDPNECEQRVKDIFLRNKWKANGNLFLWHLRGKAFGDPKKFADRLLRKANAEHFEVVIIDPIYKLNAGDENDASKMAQMFVQFDRIASDLNSTVIISHHHSKGAQSDKSAMDRASGSGVFARSPDAVVDMLELYVDDTRREMILEKYKEDGVTEASMQANGAWQIQFTLRYFPRPEPLNVFFTYPVHVLDTECLLSGCGFVDRQKQISAGEDKKASFTEQLDLAFEYAKDKDNQWGAMSDFMQLSAKTLMRKASENCPGRYTFRNSGRVERNTQ